MWFNFALTLGLIALLYSIRRIFNGEHSKKPPGPFRWPILGNLVQLALAIRRSEYVHKALTELCVRYGEVMYLEAAASDIVVVSGHDSIKAALRTENFLPRVDPTETIHMERSFGKPIGLVNSSGEFWKQTRRFALRYMRDFGFAKQDQMNKFIREEYVALQELFAKDEDDQKQVVVKPGTMFNITNANLAWRSISGQRFVLDDPLAIALVRSMERIFRDMKFIGGVANVFPFLLDWFPGLTGRTDLTKHANAAYSYTRQLVAKIRAAGKYKERQDNFVEAYLKAIDDQAGEPEGEAGIYTDENLVVTISDLFVASQDTSAATLAFFFRYMLLYPEVQSKMRQEIKDFIEPQLKVSLEDKALLKYCQAVTWESHRHATVAPIAGRRCFEETTFNGYVVPAKSTIIINYFSANHDPKVWDDPEAFRPQRFLNSEGEVVNTGRVFVHGGGKRDCVGQTVAKAAFFLFATNFVKDYDILPVPGETYSLDNVSGITSAPKPYKFILKKL